VRRDNGVEIETAIPVLEEEIVDLDLRALMAVEGKRRGRKPVKAKKLARWLYDYPITSAYALPAGAIYESAGAAFSDEIPNPLGEKGVDGRWTNSRSLLRAADRISGLHAPGDGKRIETFRNERGRWIGCSSTRG
jgi:hypothetical protein